jgi:hypothetical protein
VIYNGFPACHGIISIINPGNLPSVYSLSRETTKGLAEVWSYFPGIRSGSSLLTPQPGNTVNVGPPDLGGVCDKHRIGQLCCRRSPLIGQRRRSVAPVAVLAQTVGSWLMSS